MFTRPTAASECFVYKAETLLLYEDSSEQYFLQKENIKCTSGVDWFFVAFKRHSDNLLVDKISFTVRFGGAVFASRCCQVWYSLHG